jgi:hypothetical protein
MSDQLALDQRDGLSDDLIEIEPHSFHLGFPGKRPNTTLALSDLSSNARFAQATIP